MASTTTTSAVQSTRLSNLNKECYEGDIELSAKSYNLNQLDWAQLEELVDNVKVFKSSLSHSSRILVNNPVSLTRTCTTQCTCLLNENHPGSDAELSTESYLRYDWLQVQDFVEKAKVFPLHTQGSI